MAGECVHMAYIEVSDVCMYVCTEPATCKRKKCSSHGVQVCRKCIQSDLNNEENQKCYIGWLWRYPLVGMRVVVN